MSASDCGILTAGLTGGILLGSLVATTLSTAMTHDQLATYGWRIPFLLAAPSVCCRCTCAVC